MLEHVRQPFERIDAYGLATFYTGIKNGIVKRIRIALAEKIVLPTHHRGTPTALHGIVVYQVTAVEGFGLIDVGTDGALVGFLAQYRAHDYFHPHLCAAKMQNARLVRSDNVALRKVCSFGKEFVPPFFQTAEKVFLRA